MTPPDAVRPLVIIVAAALLAAGCGGGHRTATPTPSLSSVSVPPPASTTTTSAPPPAPSGSPATTHVAAPAPTGRCTVADLSGTVTFAGPATGHRYAVLRLTNTAGHDCTIYGYAGMKLIGASGNGLPTNVVRESSPAPRQVVLQPGKSAWTMLRWSVVPADGEPAHGVCEPAPRSAWVTPPDDTAHLTVSWTFGAVCASGTVWATAFAAGTGP